MEEKKKFTVKQTFDLNGATHEAGSTVELTDEEAKDLLAAGKIEAAA